MGLFSAPFLGISLFWNVGTPQTPQLLDFLVAGSNRIITTANLFSYLRWMPPSPKGLNTATLIIPKLLIPYWWFPCPFPSPVSTCSYLGAIFVCMVQEKKRQRISVFSVSLSLDCLYPSTRRVLFSWTSFFITITTGYFLVVVYVQQNKSSWVLSVSDAFILFLCCLFLFVYSTLVIL